jgi:uncharacterized protein
MTDVIGFAPVDMLVLGTSAFLVGMRRGGVQGPEVIGVIVLVERFSAAASVGIAVLIFLYADVQATVLLFRRVDWRVLGRLLGPTVAGVALGALVGRLLPIRVFEWTFFAILLTAYATLVVQHFRPLDENPPPLPKIMTPLAGLLSGITSMIGNMASLFVAIYFMAIRAEKEQFIATSAWFFFTLNVLKLPIHIWGWQTLTGVMLARTLILFPVVTAGIWLGRVIVHRLEEAVYWRVVVAMVGLALVRLLLVMTGVA